MSGEFAACDAAAIWGNRPTPKPFLLISYLHNKIWKQKALNVLKTLKFPFNKSIKLLEDLRMDFAVVVLGVHDDDEMCRDVDAPAEWTRGHHHLNSTCQRGGCQKFLIFYCSSSYNKLEEQSRSESYPSWRAAPLFCVQLQTGPRAGSQRRWPESLWELSHLFCPGMEQGLSQCNVRTYRETNIKPQCKNIMATSALSFYYLFTAVISL